VDDRTFSLATPSGKSSRSRSAREEGRGGRGKRKSCVTRQTRDARAVIWKQTWTAALFLSQRHPENYRDRARQGKRGRGKEEVRYASDEGRASRNLETNVDGRTFFSRNAIRKIVELAFGRGEGAGKRKSRVTRETDVDVARRRA